MLDAKLETEAKAVAAGVGFEDKKLIGKAKNDPSVLTAINDYFAKLVHNKHLLPKDYLFVGNGNHAENLKLFCTTNAFFTPAIGIETDPQTHERVFVVNSIDVTKAHPTLFSRAIEMYDASYPRVNATFDFATFTFRSHRVYDAQGQPLAGYSDPNVALPYLCTLLLYFSQVIHATIHIFDLIMVTGILDATEHNSFLFKFIDPFPANIFLKYLEVEKLLITKEGALTTTAFRSDYSKLILFSKELLVLWLHQPSADALLRHFFFSGITATAGEAALEEILDSTLILHEWRQHLSHARPFTQQLVEVFDHRHAGVIDTTDKILASYFRGIGDGVATVASFQTWMELMVGMNLLHGNTLSMTRLQLHPSVLATLTPAAPKFTDRDDSLVILLLGTISGIEPHRRVFGSSILATHTEYPLLRHAVIQYDAVMTNAQMAFYQRLKADPEYFRQYGWILTDYCLEGIDGKQMTLTTYV